MALSISMLIISCISIIICTAKNLTIEIKKFKLHLYWVIPLICAIILLATNTVDFKGEFIANITSNSNMNPLKVLTIFISMSAISIFLDQAGLFRWLAANALKKASKSQIRLFILLYCIISVITIATSNSTIILTFTPFICYFAKHSGIDPIPYLFGEFVAANTFSMFLLIGNATNTYLASSFGITFIEYIQYMAIPTIFSALTSLGILLLIFRKQLSQPFQVAELHVEIKNKPALIVGVIGLLVCTILLIISSYIGVEMWIVSLASALFVLIFGSLCYLIKKQTLHKPLKTIRRMPWHLVPFLLSMFVIVLALENVGITQKIASVFDNKYSVLSFGTMSALVSNAMNNIPMSILFTNILLSINPEFQMGGIFAAIIGSNIGSLLTPVASMSAIMWRSIIRHKHVKFSFLTFVKYGFIIAIPSLFAALGGLELMLIAI